MPAVRQKFHLSPCAKFRSHFSFSGVVHVATTTTTSASGNFNIVQHSDWSDVKGTDPLGNVYVVHDTNNNDIHFQGSGGEILTFGQSAAMNTTGSAPNFRVQDILHITIAADGSVRSFVDNFTSTCP